jgi:hypothetical protein
MFMTGINVNAAWNQLIVDAAEVRNYDLEILLDSPENAAKVLAVISSLPVCKKLNRGISCLLQWAVPMAWRSFKPILMEVMAALHSVRPLQKAISLSLCS